MRKKLYRLVVWGLDRQFEGRKDELYETVKFLWGKVIFDDPTRGVKVRGNPRGWRKLPRDKSLFTQPAGRGIVIGNLVPMEQKEQLLRDIKVIEKYLKSLGLTLHPKNRYAENTKHGAPFLGVVVHEGYIVPGNRVKKNCRQAFTYFAEGRGELESIISYLGHLEHINSKKFLKKVFDELGWDFGDER